MLQLKLSGWDELNYPPELWTQLRQRPELQHPFFGYHWFAAAQKTWGNVEVLHIQRSGEADSFLPFQRKGGNVAVPVGYHFSDAQGVIGPKIPPLDSDELLRVCHLQALDFDHALPGTLPWDVTHWHPSSSPVVRLASGFDSLCAIWRSQGSAWDTLCSKERKLIRERGPWTYVAASRDPALLDTLIAWKRSQYRRTGVADALGTPNDRAFLHALFQTNDPTHAWQARLSVLLCQQRPIALHLGLCENGIWHYWFPAYDPDYSLYSPGLLLLREIIREACQLSFHLLDFGKGDSRYKSAWSNDTTPLLVGSLLRPGPVAAARWLERTLRQTTRALGGRALKRMWSRLKSGSSPHP